MWVRSRKQSVFPLTFVRRVGIMKEGVKNIMIMLIHDVLKFHDLFWYFCSHPWWVSGILPAYLLAKEKATSWFPKWKWDAIHQSIYWRSGVVSACLYGLLSHVNHLDNFSSARSNSMNWRRVAGASSGNWHGGCVLLIGLWLLNMEILLTAPQKSNLVSFFHLPLNLNF